MKAHFEESKMNTRFLMKLGVVVVALLMNSLIVGGAAYVVSAQSEKQTSDGPVACTAKKFVLLKV
jgi:hypothetical protein